MSITTAQIKKIVKVASGIIYSQEGDYGSVNKNDNKHGMSIGKCQWNAYWGRALPLLQTITNKDQDQAKEILGESLYNEITGSSAKAWDKKVREATEEEAKVISELLKTKHGKEVQDDLADEDITRYIKNGIKAGLVSMKALAYYADLENQGGSGASKEIATTAGNALGSVAKVGLEEIHTYAMKDSVMGQYESRRGNVYQAVKNSELPDVSEKKEEQGKDTAQTTPNGSNSIEKGDTVTFIGGGVYKSSTAVNASTEKAEISKCRVTAINLKGKRPYHLVSQDGKGVCGWVDVESIKELATTAQNDHKTVSKGDTVIFTGGPVYKSSTVAQAATTKNVTSKCKVTATNDKGLHPYHCISQDGKGIYGWVDKENVK